MIDIQFLKKKEEIRHISNQDFPEAHKWLAETYTKLREANKSWDEIAFQLYDVGFSKRTGKKEYLPAGSVEVDSIERAHAWLELQEKLLTK